MNKDNKIVVVEYMDDSGAWTFYEAIINATPVEALELYAEEMGYEDTATEDGGDGYMYLVDDNVRAWETVLTIHTPNKK